MKSRLLLLGMLLSLTCGAQELKIRGVLPWHNFLSGPSAWNLEDYRQYLDECREKGINLIAFHNYTGGGERYVNYVEPMIRISYKNVLPAAGFDHSGMARWGYLPMRIDDFAFGTSRLFRQNKGAYFGADCAVTAHSDAQRYDQAQALMKAVLDMAHERQMRMAMGFEFGVAPPEYASVRTHGDMYWLGSGSLVYNPFDPDAAGILYATIDDILNTYKGIDYIWLWLNEHSIFGVDVESALRNPQMNAWYQRYAASYTGKEMTPMLKFFGTWSQAYIQRAYDYIKKKSPGTQVVIGGWGGKAQMTLLLQGLNRTLPKDIIFSLLNPAQGLEIQPPVFKEIAQDRKVWAIPWLEGDQSLWHLQPRVNIIRTSVKQAAADGLDGVVAIHWRTAEAGTNFDAYTHFATHPADDMSSEAFYASYCAAHYGQASTAVLASLLAQADSSGILSTLKSDVYFAYDPSWGRMSEAQTAACQAILDEIKRCEAEERDGAKKANLQWLGANYAFALLLDRVGRAMAPAWQLREAVYAGTMDLAAARRQFPAARAVLRAAPMQQLFTVFADKVRSRGELGELSSLNQRVWGEYQLLDSFLKL